MNIMIKIFQLKLLYLMSISGNSEITQITSEINNLSYEKSHGKDFITLSIIAASGILLLFIKIPENENNNTEKKNNNTKKKKIIKTIIKKRIEAEKKYTPETIEDFQGGIEDFQGRRKNSNFTPTSEHEINQEYKIQAIEEKIEKRMKREVLEALKRNRPTSRKNSESDLNSLKDTIKKLEKNREKNRIELDEINKHLQQEQEIYEYSRRNRISLEENSENDLKKKNLERDLERDKELASEKFKRDKELALASEEFKESKRLFNKIDSDSQVFKLEKAKKNEKKKQQDMKEISSIVDNLYNFFKNTYEKNMNTLNSFSLKEFTYDNDLDNYSEILEIIQTEQEKNNRINEINEEIDKLTEKYNKEKENLNIKKYEEIKKYKIPHASGTRESELFNIKLKKTMENQYKEEKNQLENKYKIELQKLQLIKRAEKKIIEIVIYKQYNKYNFILESLKEIIKIQKQLFAL